MIHTKGGLRPIAYALVIIGALNWGLVGLFGENVNIVHIILGFLPVLERLVYIIVGLSAVFLIIPEKLPAEEKIAPQKTQEPVTPPAEMPPQAPMN